MYKAYFRFVKTAVVLAVILALTACSAFQPSQEKKPPLRIEFTDWWGDYTMIVAQELGLFEKYGVEVEPVHYSVFANALPDLAAAQLDAGLFAIGDALNVSRHTPLTIVAVYDNGGFNTVLSTSDINSAADLKGKRIGVPLGTTYELVISEMLRNAGLSINDVTLVNVLPEEIPARLGDDIQAGFVYEPYTSDALALGNKLFFSSEAISGLFPDVIVFREQVINERPEDVRAFLKAWFEAVEYRKTNAEDANLIISEYYNIAPADFLPETNVQIFDAAENKALFASQNNLNLRPISETARLNGDFLVRIGTLGKLPDFEKFLDPEFLN